VLRQSKLRVPPRPQAPNGLHVRWRGAGAPLWTEPAAGAWRWRAWPHAKASRRGPTRPLRPAAQSRPQPPPPPPPPPPNHPSWWLESVDSQPTSTVDMVAGLAPWGARCQGSYLLHAGLAFPPTGLVGPLTHECRRRGERAAGGRWWGGGAQGRGGGPSVRFVRGRQAQGAGRGGGEASARTPGGQHWGQQPPGLADTVTWNAPAARWQPGGSSPEAACRLAAAQRPGLATPSSSRRVASRASCRRRARRAGGPSVEAQVCSFSSAAPQGPPGRRGMGGRRHEGSVKATVWRCMVWGSW
jgi:hypothetical protein